jgi:hypothetical protein
MCYFWALLRSLVFTHYNLKTTIHNNSWFHRRFPLLAFQSALHCGFSSITHIQDNRFDENNQQFCKNVVVGHPTPGRNFSKCSWKCHRINESLICVIPPKIQCNALRNTIGESSMEALLTVEFNKIRVIFHISLSRKDNIYYYDYSNRVRIRD